MIRDDERRILDRLAEAIARSTGAVTASPKLQKAWRRLLRLEARAERKARESQRITAARIVHQYLACTLLLAKAWMATHGRASKPFRVNRRHLLCPQMPTPPWTADLLLLVDRAEDGESEARTELLARMEHTPGLREMPTRYQERVVAVLVGLIGAGKPDEQEALVEAMGAMMVPLGRDPADPAERLLLGRVGVSWLFARTFGRIPTPAGVQTGEMKAIEDICAQAQQAHLRAVEDLRRYGRSRRRAAPRR